MQTFLLILVSLILVSIPIILLVKYAGLTSLFRNTPMYLTPKWGDLELDQIFKEYQRYCFEFLGVNYVLYPLVSMALNEILPSDKVQLECYLDRQIDSDYSIKLLKYINKPSYFSCTVKEISSSKTIYYDEVRICPEKYKTLFGFGKSVTIYAKIIPA